MNRSPLLLLLSLIVLPFVAFALPARPIQSRGSAEPMASATEVTAPRALSQLKSFKDWKSDKVRMATQQAEQTRSQVLAMKIEGAKTPAMRMAQHSLEQQFAQEQWNVEVASDLSVTDYLALYLAQHASSRKLAEAAGKLTPDEMAQVLEAYIRSMGSFPSDAKKSLRIHALQGR